MKIKCENEDCDVEFDTDVDDCRWSSLLEKYVCWDCYQSLSDAPSTIIHVKDQHEVCKWLLNDFEIVDAEYGEEPFSEDASAFTNNLKRVWKSTSAWRGHYETTIEGWREITTGWTTGNWGDSVGQRKQTFNVWAEAVTDGEIRLPVPVAIVCDPTSNVFSTAIGLWVAEDDYDTLKEFLAEGLGELHDSLS